MHKTLLLWLFSALLPGLAQAIPFSETNPPTCDTLTATNGETYLVLVGWEGDREIQYRLCDDESGRVYSMKRDSIRELKKGKKIVAAPVPKISSKKNVLPRDTFDLLTLTNGKTYRVVVLVRDYFNTYYRLYDDPLDDREYYVSNQEVRSLRMPKSHRVAQTRKKSSGCLAILLIPLGLLFVVLLASLGN